MLHKEKYSAQHIDKQKTFNPILVPYYQITPSQGYKNARTLRESMGTSGSHN